MRFWSFYAVLKDSGQKAKRATRCWHEPVGDYRRQFYRLHAVLLCFPVFILGGELFIVVDALVLSCRHSEVRGHRPASSEVEEYRRCVYSSHYDDICTHLHPAQVSVLIPPTVERRSLWSQTTR